MERESRETAPRDDGRQPRQLHAVSQGPNADYLIPSLLRLIPLLLHPKKIILRHTRTGVIRNDLDVSII
jgi:hypothetical protein